MYIPAHFAADDTVVHELLARHGAADLITVTEEGLLATMLPFVYEQAEGEHGALHGHLARNNDQWRRPALGESLAIVRGPDAYISPSWYAAKAEHGRVVPTWNYVTAHVYGRLVVHDDPGWVEGLVRRLTAKHEAALARDMAELRRACDSGGDDPASLAACGGGPEPPRGGAPLGRACDSGGDDPPEPPRGGASLRRAWSVDDAPRAYVEGQLRAIVGVELRITRIQAKAKLSQNRPAADIAGVIAGLTARGEDRSAAAVRQASERQRTP